MAIEQFAATVTSRIHTLESRQQLIDKNGGVGFNFSNATLIPVKITAASNGNYTCKMLKADLTVSNWVLSNCLTIDGSELNVDDKVYLLITDGGKKWILSAGGAVTQNITQITGATWVIGTVTV